MEVELRWCPRPSSRGDGSFSARIPEGSPGSGIGGVVSSPVLPTQGLWGGPGWGPGRLAWVIFLEHLLCAKLCARHVDTATHLTLKAAFCSGCR